MIGVTSEAAARPHRLHGHTILRCERCRSIGPNCRLPALYLMVRNYGTKSVETKIGISKEPCKRLSAINKWAPTLGRAELYAVTLPMPDAEAVEAELHWHFAAARCADDSSTEWFAVAPELVLEVYPEAARKVLDGGRCVCLSFDEPWLQCGAARPTAKTYCKTVI